MVGSPVVPTLPTLADRDHFAQRQIRLLGEERRADVEEQEQLVSSLSIKALQARGLAVTDLVVGAKRTGLGGKVVVDLEWEGTERRECGVRTGDIVRIQSKGGDAVTGVVVRVWTRIAVALEQDMTMEGRVWIVKLANDSTYTRMTQTMKKISTASSPLAGVLFGSEPTFSPQKMEILDTSLNDSQRDAVRFALSANHVALIHGPPGTGKTYTLIELLRQFSLRGQKVLVCGPSNISVDNLVERLAPFQIPMVRLGHPARILPSVVLHSMDMVARSSNAGEIVRDVRAEMDSLLASVSKTRSGAQKRAIYGRLKEARKEYRVREKKTIDDIIRGAQLVLATLHGAGSSSLHMHAFDVVVIDEASQALEAQCWIPALVAPKLILAGDHMQLPPTVHAASGLQQTMFDRLLALHGPRIKQLLEVQYRMHELIMQFPSQKLYDGRLKADEMVAHRLLADLPNVTSTDDTSTPLVFIDTQGDAFPESADDHAGVESRLNVGEAGIVAQHVQALWEAGVAADAMAVITPYNAQVAQLRSMLEDPALEIGSVDGFQGREKEAVVVSLVRSNEARQVGFLAESRRLNVAMTRPRRHLCIVGDAVTVARGSDFLRSWMEFLEEHADVRYP